jgi:hypothetical protein
MIDFEIYYQVEGNKNLGSNIITATCLNDALLKFYEGAKKALPYAKIRIEKVWRKGFANVT